MMHLAYSVLLTSNFNHLKSWLKTSLTRPSKLTLERCHKAKPTKLRAAKPLSYTGCKKKPARAHAHVALEIHSNVFPLIHLSFSFIFSRVHTALLSASFARARRSFAFTLSLSLFCTFHCLLALSLSLSVERGVSFGWVRASLENARGRGATYTHRHTHTHAHVYMHVAYTHTRGYRVRKIEVLAPCALEGARDGGGGGG